MVYTLDVISALLTILLKGEKGNAYNVSNPDTFMSIYDRANYLFDNFNKNCKVEIAEEDTSINAGFLPKRQLKHNVDKLVKLGWEARTSLYDIYRIDTERFK
jgi:nucleoside-diphosphate-sugar epimerase